MYVFQSLKKKKKVFTSERKAEDQQKQNDINVKRHIRQSSREKQ